MKTLAKWRKKNLEGGARASKCTKNARKNLSKALRGKSKPADFGAKISEANKRRKTDPIFQQKVKEKRSQRIKANFTQENIESIQDKLHKKYSISRIVRELNITRSNVDLLIDFYNLGDK